MNTIVSKRTSPFTYQAWKYVNGQFFPDGPGIVINGGAGIVGGLELLSGRPLMQRNSIIPVGVHTYVDDDVLDKLYKIPKFKKDVDRGIILVIKGKKLDQDKTDSIAANEMVEDDHIPTRPITEEEIQNAGATINKDGSINIGEVEVGDHPLRQRAIEAGQPQYVKERMRSERAQNKDERKRASGRKRK